MDLDVQLRSEFDRPIIQLYTPDEIYEMADEVLLRKMFEDVRFEMKCNAIHCKEVGEYFSMWANTSPSGGLLLVGIRMEVR